MEEPKITILNTPSPQAKKRPTVLIVAGFFVAACLVVAAVVTHSSGLASGKRQAVVELTAAGFVPATLDVPVGTQIVWRNMDQAPHLVASNPYPSDSSVPGLHSNTLLPGDSYAYVASTAGTIKYHDQSNPSLNGSIMVEN
jgi:plastocyanin